MSMLTTMKFDGSRTMHEHVIEMTNIVAKLKTSEMTMNENFMVQFILNSLPSEYDPFQMSYNTMKDKWNVMSCTICWFRRKQGLRSRKSLSPLCKPPRESRLKIKAGKKFTKKHDKGKKQLKIIEALVQIQKKASKSNNCHCCGKAGHF